MKPTPRSFCDEADALFGLRSEIKNVHASVALLQEAADDDFEAAWRLGRSFWFLGQEATGGREAREYHSNGVASSRRAAELEPNRVEGHFWLGVNYALLAKDEHPLRAIVHALRAREALKRAARISPTYHAAGPLRVLGRLAAGLPRWLGGGGVRAENFFELAIRLAPANSVTRIYFAELLIARGETTRARTHLQAVLSVPPDPDWKFEQERDRRLAGEMLRKL